MGCVQSLSAGRRRSRSADGAKKRAPLPPQLSLPPHGKSLEREKAITARAMGRSSVEYRHQQQHHGQDDAGASPEADLPINWNLRFKDLVILEHIANGGYCTVLACMLNGQKRAVKIPLANCSDPEGAVADLTNEIRILKRLRHPHLCSVYGAGGWRTEGELPFLVLERLQYQNLAQQCGTEADDTSMRAQLKQRKLRAKFPFRRRLGYGLQLADLLRYLHRGSIRAGFVVHRDLKPSNIGVSDDGVLKVFDFGLARVREQRDPLTDRYVMTGQTGSQRFMAPEVFDGMPYNEKADMYSYGIVLWELCTLRKPFAGMSSHEHARKVFRHGMRPALDSRWPEELKRLLQSCWHAEPEMRPEASQAVEILARIIEKMDAGGFCGGTATASASSAGSSAPTSSSRAPSDSLYGIGT
ncbi:unnamed protein product [Scytosiphon promiscuus]